MDKFEYELKVEQIEKLIVREDYSTAKKIADTMEWKREKDTKLLSHVAELYAQAGDVQKALHIYNLAYNASSRGLLILERMIELAINFGQLELADEVCEEYLTIGGFAADYYLMKFQISESRGESQEQRIAYLEKYCNKELDEDALYRLAWLYDRVGRVEDCVRICDYIIDFFCCGETVERAITLKKNHAALTKYQERRVTDAARYEENYRQFLDAREEHEKRERSEQQQEKQIREDALMEKQEDALAKQITEIVEQNEKEKQEIHLDELVADEELMSEVVLPTAASQVLDEAPEQQSTETIDVQPEGELPGETPWFLKRAAEAIEKIRKATEEKKAEEEKALEEAFPEETLEEETFGEEAETTETGETLEAEVISEEEPASEQISEEEEAELEEISDTEEASEEETSEAEEAPEEEPEIHQKAQMEFVYDEEAGEYDEWLDEEEEERIEDSSEQSDTPKAEFVYDEVAGEEYEDEEEDIEALSEQPEAPAVKFVYDEVAGEENLEETAAESVEEHEVEAAEMPEAEISAEQADAEPAKEAETEEAEETVEEIAETTATEEPVEEAAEVNAAETAEAAGTKIEETPETEELKADVLEQAEEEKDSATEQASDETATEAEDLGPILEAYTNRELPKGKSELAALDLVVPEGSFKVTCGDTALGVKYAVELVRMLPEEERYDHVAKVASRQVNKVKFSKIEQQLDNDILLITDAGQLSNGALESIYLWMKKSLNNRVILVDSQQQLESLEKRKPKLMKRFPETYFYEHKDTEQWLELVDSYVDENDCVLDDGAFQLFEDYLREKEEKGDVVLGVTLKDAVQDAMRQATKFSISNVMAAILNTKYDDDGFLILSDRHFR